MKSYRTLEEYEKEIFTKEEIKEIDKMAKERIKQRALKELRKELGLTQEELSEKSGIPRTTITKIETGYMNVSIGKLQQLANAMGKDIEISLVDRKKVS